MAVVFTAVLCAPIAVTEATAPASADSVQHLNASINHVAQAWFDAQTSVQRLDDQIAQDEQRTHDLESRARKLRVEARERAVAMYVGKNDTIGAVLDGSSAIDSARRVQLIEGANERSVQTFESLSELVSALKAQHDTLVHARSAKRAALNALSQNRAALEAQLEQARAAAVQAAQRANVSTARVVTTGGHVTVTPATERAPAPAPATAPAAVPVTVVAAPPSSGEYPMHNHPFLVCTRSRESHGIYTVVSPSGIYFGAYQFSRDTWDVTAIHAGRPSLVGVLPSAASAYDQDNLAWVLYQWQGTAPWGGRC